MGIVSASCAGELGFPLATRAASDPNRVCAWGHGLKPDVLVLVPQGAGGHTVQKSDTGLGGRVSGSPPSTLVPVGDSFGAGL